MNTKIAISLMTIAIAAAIAVSGTVAYFTDSETSIGNTFTAGTLDLGLANTNGTNPTGSTTATWTANTWVPGGTKDATLYVNNAGSVGATKTNVSFDYSMTEGTPSTVDAGTTVLDDMIKATTVKWDGVTVAALQGKTLEELKALGATDLGGLTAATEKGLEIEWTLDTAADNGIQGDGVTVSINVELVQ